MDEQVSYIIEEEEDCSNQLEREAFSLCLKHQKAIAIGKTIAAPCCECESTSHVTLRRQGDEEIFSCLSCFEALPPPRSDNQTWITAADLCMNYSNE